MNRKTIINKRKTIINIGRAQLGLDEDTYRALLVRVTGKDSLRLMSESEQDAVVEELKRLGFKLKAGGKRPPAPRADLRLIHVLWARLAQAGALTKPTREGLNTFVRAQFGEAWGTVPADIDMLRDHRQIDAVVQALKAWCRRAGVALPAGGRK